MTIQSMKTESFNENLEWDSRFKHFLKEWFSGLMNGIKRLDSNTWFKILEMTGQACARAHSDELYWEIWEATREVNEFIAKKNEMYKEEFYEKIDENTISVCYSKCMCPLVKHGLVDSHLLCNCTSSRLLENFETILKKPVTVTTKNTILRGASSCNFIISF